MDSSLPSEKCFTLQKSFWGNGFIFLVHPLKHSFPEWDILEWYLECLSTEILITSGPSLREELNFWDSKMIQQLLTKRKANQSNIEYFATKVWKRKMYQDLFLHGYSCCYLLAFCCRLFTRPAADKLWDNTYHQPLFDIHAFETILHIPKCSNTTPGAGWWVKVKIWKCHFCSLWQNSRQG